MTSKKSLAVGRIMPRGPHDSINERLKYIHLGPEGTTALSLIALARVHVANEPFKVPVILPQKSADGYISAVTHDTTVEIKNDVLPAVTSPEYLVPNFDNIIPDPAHQLGYVTVNGAELATLLKIANEVNQDSQKTIRLRFYDRTLRLDTYRQPGNPEFVGVLQGITYSGEYIPGDKSPSGNPEIKPVAAYLPLKANAGRKFRS